MQNEQLTDAPTEFGGSLRSTLHFFFDGVLNMLFATLRASPLNQLLKGQMMSRSASSIASSVSTLKGQDFMSIDQLRYVRERGGRRRANAKDTMR